MTVFIKINIKLFLSTLIVYILFAFSHQSLAEVDLNGKSIKWVVPFSEGGGADVLARFYAPLLSQNLPGNPNVEVINMP